MKARRCVAKPTAPGQATFLPIPRGSAYLKHKVLGLSSCSPDPREEVETRHEVPGNKGEHEYSHI